MPATTESSLFTDANALGFLNGCAHGSTILPFEHTFAITELDEIGDRVRLAPMRANGGRNRLVLVGLYWADLEGAAGTLRAKLTVYQNGADSEVLAASAIFNTVSTAGTIYWILLTGDDLILDDTSGDQVGTLDFVVTAAAGNPIAAKLQGILIYE